MKITSHPRRFLAVAAGTAAAALVLTSCANDGSETVATEPASWTITEQTPKPSGDIDEITWVSYSEP